MFEFIKSQPEILKVEQVAISPRFAKLDRSRLDEATVLKADITVPIVLAEISPGHFNVIDGNHRVERALRDGVKLLPAFRIGPEHHVVFLTTALGYEKYAEYWNERLAEK